MVMTATTTVFEWSVVRHNDQREQSNPFGYHALWVSFFLLLSPCSLVLESADEPTEHCVWFIMDWETELNIFVGARTRSRTETDIEDECIRGAIILSVRGGVEGQKGGLFLLVHLEKDLFEVKAMERQGSAQDPGAKWIQMSEHVHKVEPTCTVVVFPCSKVQSLLFSSFFLAVSHFLPTFFLFRVLSHSVTLLAKENKLL